MNFTSVQLPRRIIFGTGRVSELGEEIKALGISRPIAVSTPGGANRANAILEASSVVAARFNGAEMHAPAECVERALSAAKNSDADGVIACGGGSAVGIAKAMAVSSYRPIVAITTTYSGSEMTPVYSMTREGAKTGGQSIDVLPKLVIYDPELTLDLPVPISVTSALNSLAHCVEGLYSIQRDPMVDRMASDAIGLIAKSLPRIVEQPNSVVDRENLLYASCLGGMVMTSAGMALHHKACHVLGGTFGLPHAETHAVLLPYVMRYNASVAHHAMSVIEHEIKQPDAPFAIYSLGQAVGAPRGLKALGMPEEGLNKAAEMIVNAPYYNPRTPEIAGILDMLRAAWSGEAP